MTVTTSPEAPEGPTPAPPAYERRPPPRGPIERKLRRASLFSVVDGTAPREYALHLASSLRRLSIVAFVSVLVAGVLRSTWQSDPTMLRYGTVFPFDVLAGGVLFTSVVYWDLMRRRRGQRDAILAALVGLTAAAGYTLLGQVGVVATGLDAQAADMLIGSSAEAGAQNILIHLAVIVGVAAALLAEGRLRLVGQMSSLAVSAGKATPATLNGALRTLPAALTVLFFIGFVEETWKIFGMLSVPKLIAVVWVLLACVTAVVVKSARSEARSSLRALEASNADVPRLFDPDDESERDKKVTEVDRLIECGAELGGLRADRQMRLAVFTRWLSHVATTVFLAGFIVAFLMTVITGLAVPEDLVQGWLAKQDPGAPHKIWEAEALSFYLSREGIFVSIVLGCFAAVVFAGSALSSRQSLDELELMNTERARVWESLMLARAYHSADAKKLWRGKPHATWPSYSSFLLDEPKRRGPDVERFGSKWRDATTGVTRRALYRVEYNVRTGELYVWRWRPHGEVKVLAAPLGQGWPTDDKERIGRNLSVVRRHLDGWQDHEDKENSLNWLSEAGRPDPAGVRLIAGILRASSCGPSA